tara:strand:- start:33415 stop:34863 length:1449 start_codon:yes stop_codon:yes gene_type:complete
MEGIFYKIRPQITEIIIKLLKNNLKIERFLISFTIQIIILKKPLSFILVFFFGLSAISQNYSLPNSKKKDKINFQLVNNLVIIPVSINGKELSFILDTGASHTLLFSLTDIDSLEIKDVSKVKIRGMGSEGLIDALKSKNNTVAIGDTKALAQTLYVVYDETVSLSPKMGVPIHGVIGYDFLKDFVVETNYNRQKLIVYNPSMYRKKRSRRYAQFKLDFENDRPFINAVITHPENEKEVRLLLDSGSSDALWLFDEKNGIVADPQNYFNDFLGTGISGAIHGKKSKLESLSIGNFSFENVKVSYPDSSALKELSFQEDRDGSLGGAILRRFKVVINYPEETLTLRKNSHYNDPFHYNMAGAVFEQNGLISVEGYESNGGYSLKPKNNVTLAGVVEIMVNPILYQFMAPRFVLSEVRENSPVEKAGLKIGDVLISINGKEAFKFKLYEINALFSQSREGKRIQMVVSRNGIEMEFRFTLKKVL